MTAKPPLPAQAEPIAGEVARLAYERAAKVAEDAAEGSRVLHNLAAKDRDRDGTNIHGEGWRTGKEIATAIRALSTGERA